MESGMNTAKRFMIAFGIASLAWGAVGCWLAVNRWGEVYRAVGSGKIDGINLGSAATTSLQSSLSSVGIMGSILLFLVGLMCSGLIRRPNAIAKLWRLYLLIGITLIPLSLFGSDLFFPLVVGSQKFSLGLGSIFIADIVGWSGTSLSYLIVTFTYVTLIGLLYPRIAALVLSTTWRLQNRVIGLVLQLVSMGVLYISSYLVQIFRARHFVKPVKGLSNGSDAANDSRVDSNPQQPNESLAKQSDLISHDEAQVGASLFINNEVSLCNNDSLMPVSYSLPSSELLYTNHAEYRDATLLAERAQQEAVEIENSLLQHGIEVIVRDIKAGPTVTVYGLEPGWGSSRGAISPEKRRRVTVDAILAREKDLALALAVSSLRFEAPVPGASLVGIEVPNPSPSVVFLGDVLQRDELNKEKGEGALSVVLGKSASGDREVADLAVMPHLLTAGATGSGKSMFVNSVLVSLLMQFSPHELRLLLIDPKRVELTQYNGIPHLAARVVVDPMEAVIALRGAVEEMMHRLKLLEETGSRNIDSYNSKMGVSDDKLPKLVIVVDEMADLMMLAPNDIEHALCRLAQLGRATGIHLIVATQRPSVDVITGLIKANFPSRISFAVASQTDSRTILDGPGADKLLGNGDMLFLSQDLPKPKRVQGTFVSDSEIEALVQYWKGSGYVNQPLIDLDAPSGEATEGVWGDAKDALFDEAVALSEMHSRISTSLLQRRLRIGYPRAARLRDELEKAGVLSRNGDVQSTEE